MSSSIVIPTHFDLVDEKTRKNLNVDLDNNTIVIIFLFNLYLLFSGCLAMQTSQYYKNLM